MTIIQFCYFFRALLLLLFHIKQSLLRTRSVSKQVSKCACERIIHKTRTPLTPGHLYVLRQTNSISFFLFLLHLLTLLHLFDRSLAHSLAYLLACQLINNWIWVLSFFMALKKLFTFSAHTLTHTHKSHCGQNANFNLMECAKIYGNEHYPFILLTSVSTAQQWRSLISFHSFQMNNQQQQQRGNQQKSCCRMILISFRCAQWL